MMVASVLTLLFLAPQLAPTAPAPAPGAHASYEDYQTLASSYGAALEAHKKETRKARGLKAKRELRKSHPVHSYWPKFETLAAEDGRGLLLMVTHLKDRGLARKEASPEILRLHRALTEGYAGEEWFHLALNQLAKDTRHVGEAFFREAHQQVIKTNTHPVVRAKALYALGQKLAAAADESQRAKGVELLERLVEEFPESEEGKLMENELYEIRHLGVGCEAPDFDASTLEGHAFKLSDYRGKVVLLDFYGFW